MSEEKTNEKDLVEKLNEIQKEKLEKLHMEFHEWLKKNNIVPHVIQTWVDGQQREISITFSFNQQ